MMLALFTLVVGVAIGVIFHAAIQSDATKALNDLKAEVAKLTAGK